MDEPAPDGGAAPAPAAVPSPGTAEGAPAAAPEAPAAPPQGTDAALAAARERLAKGEPLVPPAKPADAPAPGAETPGAGEPGEEPAAEPAAGEDAPTALEVELPGLADRGEEPIKLEVPDQETFERLNRLKNGYQDGLRIKAAQDEIQADREQLEQVEDMIGTDPVGFVMDRMAEQHRAAIALQLLFDPKVFEQVQTYLQEKSEPDKPLTLSDILEDPNELRVWRAEMKAERGTLERTLRQTTETRKAERSMAQVVAKEVYRLIPETITGPKREMLFRDALRDIQERGRMLNLKHLDGKMVALIVADRFREHGIDVADALLRNGQPGAEPAAPGKPAAPAPKPMGKTAAELQAASAARRAAAAPAPAGAGAPDAKARPELPKTTDERIKMARKVGLRRLLGRS